ncbi:MAG TPA: hypothetical protein VFG45_01825 [Candidatus Nitrosocosmicus sp.]|nr:hypothetical protein [Candidatus Nitrosocosmicus sp.]
MRSLPIIVVILSLFPIIIGSTMIGPESYLLGFISNNETEEISNMMYHVNSNPFNLSYADWTENWWRWTYSIPWESNPSYDDSGVNCGQHQNGPVWFLTSSFNHPTTRTCEIPSNTAILTTLLNSECSFAEYSYLKTEQQLRECAKKIQDIVSGGTASLDGQKIPGQFMYRIQTDLFNFTLPQNNILNLSSQTTQAVADGTWLFIKPLSPGIHVLKVKGDINPTTFENVTDANQYNGPIGWNQTTTYNLIIK